MVPESSRPNISLSSYVGRTDLYTLVLGRLKHFVKEFNISNAFYILPSNKELCIGGATSWPGANI
jgi:hypothetical protein